LGIVQPFEPPPSEEPFANLEQVLELAKLDNVAIKISGAGTLSHKPFPYEDIWEPLQRIFSAYGLERCLWGTDWTRAVLLLTYKEGVDAFRLNDQLSDSERSILMGGSLKNIYNWAPQS
jgi:predicted TIM-barrel fold metal-dependent hydrolase